MKKLLLTIVIFAAVCFSAISVQALPAYNYETNPCYVKAGGTFEFQTWEAETSYKISDETVATIDENGLIHGIKPGQTTVDVVVFDEDYSSWVAGGYSFSEDIYVYTADEVLSVGDNSVEGSATFTPKESGFYSFTGNSDIIVVEGDKVEYWPSADYHDIVDYTRAPNCFLKAGVTYKVRVYNYDDSSDIPVFNVKIEKSVPKILSVNEKNGSAEITVEDNYVNKYGDTVFAVLRKTADSNFKIIGYIKSSDNNKAVFTDKDVSGGETYIYYVRMVNKVGGSDFLSGFDSEGKTVTISASSEKTDAEDISPNTDDFESNLLFGALLLTSASLLCVMALLKRKTQFTK